MTVGNIPCVTGVERIEIFRQSGPIKGEKQAVWSPNAGFEYAGHNVSDHPTGAYSVRLIKPGHGKTSYQEQSSANESSVASGLLKLSGGPVEFGAEVSGSIKQEQKESASLDAESEGKTYIFKVSGGRGNWACCGEQSNITLSVFFKSVVNAAVPPHGGVSSAAPAGSVCVLCPRGANASLSNPSISLDSSFSPSVFGAADWQRHFGDIGIIPPLPSDILAILEMRCPFSGEQTRKKIIDTHIFTLIPETVGGAPLSLNHFKMLIGNLQKRTDRPSAAYHPKGYSEEVDLQRGNDGVGVSGSHWTLLTKDITDGTRKESYDEQAKKVKSKGYDVPKVLDAVVSILVHYISTGEYIYGSRSTSGSITYTRCSDRVSFEENDTSKPVSVGGFSSEGIRIGVSMTNHEMTGMGAMKTFTRIT